MKKLLLPLAIIVIAGFALRDQLPSILNPITPGQNAATGDTALQEAFRNRQSNLQVTGEGTVLRILADDNDGSRHQRFILQLANGQTVLIAHNIDLAPRVDPISNGDRIAFHGEYEWNAQGGVVHWTHKDPRGRHPDGWLKRQGSVFQ